MKLVIETAHNGYILKSVEQNDEGLPEVYTEVFQETDSQSEHQAIASLLRTIANSIGPSDGRYSEERVYIVVAPGDKNDKFTDAHSDIIFGKFDDESDS